MPPRILPVRLLTLVLLVLPALGRAVPRPVTGEELSLLTTALQKVADDFPRWAYTEHRVTRDSAGKVKSEQIIQYDPSKPYAQQWTPVMINGREPSDRDRAKYRRRGEEADPDRPSAPRRGYPTLGEAIELTGTSLADETPTHWIFELPLRRTENLRFPPEKFRVQARLRKEGAVLENLSVLLRESFRAKLVLNVKAGDATLDFVQVDPQAPPALAGISGDADWSILFFAGGTSIDLKRTELRRVKPYAERFEVKIGTLKAIDF